MKDCLHCIEKDMLIALLKGDIKIMEAIIESNKK